MAKSQNRKDNELLHLEWESKFAAVLVNARLNQIDRNK